MEPIAMSDSLLIHRSLLPPFNPESQLHVRKQLVPFYL